MDTCILWEMGPFIPPFAILKPKVLVGYVWYVSEGQIHAPFIDTKKMLTINLMKSV